MSRRNTSGARRVLVTGGAGFIGRHVIAALLQRDNQVVALQHRTPLPPRITAQVCNVICGDVCEPDVQRAATREVDAVCHLAAYIPRDYRDAAEAEQCFRVNALATLGLARAAVEQGVQRFVYLSTGNLYTSFDKPATEEDRVFPSEVATFYFVSKLAAEVYLGHVCRGFPTSAISLRIGTPYGPGEPAGTVVATFMRRAARGQGLHVLHGGKPMYNFVYVADVAGCVAAAVESGETGLYNFASGEHTSLSRLAAAVAAAYGERDVPITIEPATDRSPAGFPALYVEKSRHTWHSTPVGLAEGLRRYRASLTDGGGEP